MQKRDRKRQSTRAEIEANARWCAELERADWQEMRSKCIVAQCYECRDARDRGHDACRKHLARWWEAVDRMDRALGRTPPDRTNARALTKAKRRWKRAQTRIEWRNQP